MVMEVKNLGLWDTIRFHLGVTLQRLLWGFVAARPFFVPVLVRLNAGQWAVRTFNALRQKHNCDLFWVRFSITGPPTLLALGGGSMDAVLESSQNQADPPLKKKALSKFIPDALTISSGNEWHDRRKFNTQALDFGRRHRHSDAFAEIVSAEVAQIPARSHPIQLRWADFQRLAQKISQQVLLGPGELNRDLTTQLARIVARSNCPLRPKDRSNFSAFYQNIDRYLSRQRAAIADASIEQRSDDTAASAHCLMHDSAELLEKGTATAATRAPTQIGFWMFVLKDALELHVARTLALIAAHPLVQDRVRRDLQGNAKITAQVIDGLSYLDGCVREQLRLWTPVPMLLRRAIESFSLDGRIPIAAEQQILIYPGFYHRDAWVFGHIADQFSPDSVTERLPTVYYFSRGRQECAGETLALFLVKATLASLLARFRFDLVGPRVDPARIPYLYDHFHVKFGATPERLSGARSGRSAATARR
jgi:cytochrome P450